jgi:hypothetical protein
LFFIRGLQKKIFEDCQNSDTTGGSWGRLIVDLRKGVLKPLLCKPLAAIQRPVLDRFRHVLDGNRRFCLQVGDGAGNFQDAVVGAGGKAEFIDGYVAAAYLGIAVYFCSFKPFGLHAAGGGDPLLYGCQ